VDNDKVIDSRSSQDGLAIRRRRECVNCGRRFTTYERPEETTIKVIKKDGARVPFEREKIKRGLERACWKRPISTRQIETTTAAIENEVFSTYDSEVPSRELGELVMRYLRDLDGVAFVRFASVYRQFNDVYDFFEELRPMLGESRNPPRWRSGSQHRILSKVIAALSKFAACLLCAFGQMPGQFSAQNAKQIAREVRGRFAFYSAGVR
jgi:transcriptional repressor NrdR